MRKDVNVRKRLIKIHRPMSHRVVERGDHSLQYSLICCSTYTHTHSRTHAHTRNNTVLLQEASRLFYTVIRIASLFNLNFFLVQVGRQGKCGHHNEFSLVQVLPTAVVQVCRQGLVCCVYPCQEHYKTEIKSCS